MKNVLAIAILAGVFTWVWFNFIKEKPKAEVTPAPRIPKNVQQGLVAVVNKGTPVVSPLLNLGPCANLTGAERDTCLGARMVTAAVTNENSIRLGV